MNESTPLEKLRIASAHLGQALSEVADAIMPYIREALEPVYTLAFVLHEQKLHSVATSKEWHLYKHSKKKRVRKKYRNRLEHRL